MTKATKGVAKAAGAAKKAMAIVQGRVGILATLAKEHGEVAALLARARKTKDHPKGREERRDLLRAIRRELLSHAFAEEKTLYDRLMGIERTRGRAIHAAEEHAQIEALLEGLSALDVESASWPEVCAELADKVHHHVREEEHELFALADEVFETTELEQIDEEFKREKQVLVEKLSEAAQ
jgi:hypothetical protein